MHWMIRPTETLTLFEVMHTSSFWKLMFWIWIIPIIFIIALLRYKRIKHREI